MKWHSIIFCTLLAALTLCGADSLMAQKYPERREIRSGNRDYQSGEFTASESRYRTALEKNPDSYEARFNLANALYKQERYEESAEIFSQLAKRESSEINRANSHYNAGNALFQQEMLQEALEEYKNTLRINPGDMEAKYNYAYTKRLLENDDEDNDQNDDNNDDNDGEGDNDQKDDSGNEDQNRDNNDGDQNDDREREQQPRDGRMTPEEAEQLLQAMQMNEDKTREKVDAEEARAVGSSAKNW